MDGNDENAQVEHSDRVMEWIPGENVILEKINNIKKKRDDALQSQAKKNKRRDRKFPRDNVGDSENMNFWCREEWL